MFVWLLFLVLALNLTTLFLRHWVAPRQSEAFTVQGFVDELRACVTDQQDCPWRMDSGGTWPKAGSLRPPGSLTMPNPPGPDHR
jgi:hypothetical protein